MPRFLSGHLFPGKLNYIGKLNFSLDRCKRQPNNYFFPLHYYLA
jgi:hypothetical protein